MWEIPALLWMGCQIGKGEFSGGQPTFVFPECLKKVVREIVNGTVRNYKDPVGPPENSPLPIWHPIHNSAGISHIYHEVMLINYHSIKQCRDREMEGDKTNLLLVRNYHSINVHSPTFSHIVGSKFYTASRRPFLQVFWQQCSIAW